MEDADALAAAMCLFAYVTNNENALARYYRWLCETRVLTGPDIPSFAEFREHLQATLDHFTAVYGRELAGAA